jgi:hypothetical protein
MDFAIGGAIAISVVFLFGFQDEPNALMAMFAVQCGYSLSLTRRL